MRKLSNNIESEFNPSDPSDSKSKMSSDSEERSNVEPNAVDVKFDKELPSEYASNLPKTSPIRKGTVTELRASEIRWFYRGLGGGNKDKWDAFNGRDSLLMEVKWRQQTNIPMDAETVKTVEPHLLEKIVVLGGLYELNMQDKQIVPIYWKGKALSIVRATWFTENWQPLDHKYSELVEQEHLRVFRGQKIPESPILFGKDRPPVISKIRCEDIEVEWNSVIDVCFYSITRKSRFVRYLGLYKGQNKLFRGWHTESSLKDMYKPVGHVVFVVHGIGHKQKVNQIVKQTATMQSVLDSLFEAHYTERETRVQFIPVEWRSALKLDGGLVDKITIPHMESWRATLNSTAMDIMYYTSPLYRSEITKGLVGVLNTLYGKFVTNNPGFLLNGGKVSIFAHSLGSVISYDILTKWTPLNLHEQYLANKMGENLQSQAALKLVEELDEARKRLATLEKTLIQESLKSGGDARTLDFQVENLYCIGSPLAVFLALREQVGKNVLVYETGGCKGLYNIFHPSDPVAYRLEPLLHSAYKHVRPLVIHSHGNALTRLEYDKKNPELYKKYSRKKSKRGKSKPEEEMEKQIEALKKKEDKWNFLGLSEVGKETLSDSESVSSVGSSPDMKRKNDGQNNDYVIPEQRTNAPGGWFSRFRKPRVPSTDDRSVAVGTVGAVASSESSSKIEESEESALKIERARKKDRSSVEEKRERSSSVESDKEESKEEELFDDVEEVLVKIPHEMKLKKRLDYQVRSSRADYISYYSILTAHFTYWTNTDVMMFLLSSIYPPIPKDDSNTAEKA